jgi:hypothetical protein
MSRLKSTGFSGVFRGTCPAPKEVRHNPTAAIGNHRRTIGWIKKLLHRFVLRNGESNQILLMCPFLRLTYVIRTREYQKFNSYGDPENLDYRQSPSTFPCLADLYDWQAASKFIFRRS